MLAIYRLGIFLYLEIISLLSLFKPKAKLFLSGRKIQEQDFALVALQNEKRIWFHFPSLGEFEQGRPVLEEWKKQFPEFKILITFFSPSGYENRKQYAQADYVFYLPMDGKHRSLKAVNAINAQLVIFIKYDFWYYYFLYINEKQAGLYVISAIFRRSQVFFKPWGRLFRKILGFTSWIFVQDEDSIDLLNGIGIKKASVTGDTRFDRVLDQRIIKSALPLIEHFCGINKVFVAGSTWEKDEELLCTLAGSTACADWVFIIAPHEVERIFKSSFVQKFNLPFIKFSDLEKSQDYNHNAGFVQAGAAHAGSAHASAAHASAAHASAAHANPAHIPRILIIDNIGMLSSLYRYANIAYIGGGFGKGIHNTLEAGVNGIPVLFGPNYQRFREAVEMVKEGGAFTLNNESDLLRIFNSLCLGNAMARSGSIFGEYVRNQAGATKKIIDKIAELEGVTS